MGLAGQMGVAMGKTRQWLGKSLKLVNAVRGRELAAFASHLLNEKGDVMKAFGCLYLFHMLFDLNRRDSFSAKPIFGHSIYLYRKSIARFKP